VRQDWQILPRYWRGLCRRVRPLARDLVDAFGVPEEMLRSPGLVG
jgi:acyl-CoA oxidase